MLSNSVVSITAFQSALENDGTDADAFVVVVPTAVGVDRYPFDFTGGGSISQVKLGTPKSLPRPGGGSISPPPRCYLRNLRNDNAAGSGGSSGSSSASLSQHPACTDKSASKNYELYSVALCIKKIENLLTTSCTAWRNVKLKNFWFICVLQL